MKNHKTMKIYLYTKFERFWHWLQAAMIISLVVTGLEIHGTYTLFGFKTAVTIHNYIGLSWVVLFVLFVFWLLTTGEWKQYIPTTKKLLSVIIYYSFGIFQGKEHPVEKTPGSKHNPLQRLSYLGISTFLFPIQLLTGILYYQGSNFQGTIPLGVLAVVHTLIAILVVNFLVIHLYMTTTGHTIFGHIAGMITGWEEVHEATKLEKWETPKEKPNPIYEEGK